MTTRTESDSLTDVAVPAAAYYGAFTARAQETVGITGECAHSALGTGPDQEAAADVNNAFGQLDHDKADAVIAAAGEVADGEFDAAFVLDGLNGSNGCSSCSREYCSICCAFHLSGPAKGPNALKRR